MPLAHAGLDPAARRLMAEIGPVWGSDVFGHRDRVLAAYDPVLALAPKAGVSVTRDIAYGDHPRQVLDCFVPDGAAAAPVLVYVHGGAFIRGDKRASAEVGDNILYWFARQGVVGVNVEYRLAPEATWPAGAEDLALALDWVRREAGRLGGDPARIVALGHSAGGTHVGTYAWDPAARHLGRHLAGLVLLSPRARIEASAENPLAAGVRAYFGDDEAVHAARSPVSHAAASPLPVMIAIAEFENPLLDVYGLELAHRIALARRRAPRFLRLTGHNHTSLVAHFNTVEDGLGAEILDFTARLA